jgi:excisionase family DNA binding protein
MNNTNLLTVRQVQEILKVDRITVYRMLQDGRLKGVKIGQQWRFSPGEVERIVEGLPPSPAAAAPSRGAFPTHCTQVIQDLFSGLGNIGAVTVDCQGQPLTQASGRCRFCQVVQASASGEAACQQDWAAAITTGGTKKWRTCHAGLQYQIAPICHDTNPTAYLISGQVYLKEPGLEQQEETIRQLAADHGLNAGELLAAAREIPVVSAEKRAEIEGWPVRFTTAIESILIERAALVNRLQKIADVVGDFSTTESTASREPLR